MVGMGWGEEGDAVVAMGMEWGDVFRCGCHGSGMPSILQGQGPAAARPTMELLIPLCFSTLIYLSLLVSFL